MGNSKRDSNRHETTSQEVKSKIERQLWIGKKFLIEAKGTGKNKFSAEKDAEKKFTVKLKEHLNTGILNHSLLPDNLSLAVSKYIPVVFSEKMDNGPENNKYEIIDKKIFLESLSNLSYKKNKTIESITHLEGFENVLSEEFSSSSRLICGLGSGSVLETSITLDHTRGVPYIPGSSLKGICRSVAYARLVQDKKISFDKLEEFEEKFYGELDVDDKDILTWQLLFGAQNFKSLLLFIDAYPVKDGQLELDIMNNHYAEYYQDKKAPGDWENPVPIFFLTVKENTAFKFNVFFDNWRWEKIKNEGLKIKKGKEEILLNIDHKAVEGKVKKENFIKEIIKEALENYGVGSKRNVGYGMFKIQNN
ncbi:MAG: hypothetical protein BWY23_01935 [Spirochaetes bacterium ADurb.Bin218]|jgi:CRISPR-associated protein Cmr6|nr:MAG: hypothetical protein BWY23_01935 [Spirochaetes bacterium ADurb.Bin218]